MELFAPRANVPSSPQLEANLSSSHISSSYISHISSSSSASPRKAPRPSNSAPFASTEISGDASACGESGPVAIVTAFIRSKKDTGVRPAPTHPCARFFLFGTKLADGAAGWTLVLPHTEAPTTHNGTVLHSQSWASVLAEIDLGRRTPQLVHGPYRGVSLAPLPFDPRSLGHTQRNGSLHQNLTGMMAAKYVKCQMLHIDVLRPFTRLAWADSGLIMGVALAEQLLAMPMPSAELLLLAHPWRRPASVAKEMSQSQREQDRIAALHDYIAAQAEAYSSAGYALDRTPDLYWMCFFVIQRTPNVASMMDAWWLEIRRWQYTAPPAHKHAT